MRRSARLVSAFVCMALAVSVGLIYAGTAKAVDGGSWIGNGGGAVPGGGGGTGAGCGDSRSSYQYRIDCAGVSWIYYKAVASSGNNIVFAPFTRLGNKGSNPAAEIPNVCLNGGKGGFWHYGINAQSTSNDIFMDYSSWYHHNLYNTTTGYWGHWTTVNAQLAGNAPYSVPGAAGDATGKWPSYEWNVGQLNQELKDSDGNILYRAERV